MTGQRKGIRLLAAAVSILLVCCLLCSCSALEGCVEGCALLESIYAPQLSLTDADGCRLPVIKNSLNAQEVSDRLREHFEPLAELVRSANTEEPVLTLTYELKEEGDGYVLSSSIACLKGGAIPLEDIAIPYSGGLTLEPVTGLDFLADADAAKAYFSLTENGFAVDTTRFEEELSKRELCTLYIDYYEKASGMRPDTSRFADSVEFEPLLREGMVLGLCYGEYDLDESYAGSVNQDELTDLTATLMSALYNDACGCGSRPFTRTELLYDVLTLLDTAGSQDEAGWVAKRDRIEDVCEKLIEGREDYPEEQAMTRRLVANILLPVYEAACGEVNEGNVEYAESWLTDVYDPVCLKAYAADIISDFPSSGQIGEDHIPGFEQAPHLAASLINSCYWIDTDWDGTDRVTYLEAVTALARVDENIRAIGIDTTPYKMVNNTRDYNWYLAQYDTGAYSEVNCMPTIATMAIRWYDRNTTASAQALRQMYLPEYPEGWYMWQVMECLDEYNVPYVQCELEEDMLTYLDEGKIILTQMSEALPGYSGHCFIIYGYKKKGDTVKLLVNDPGVWDGVDEYGRRPGEQLVLDSAYCKWIMDRIAFYFVAVG